MAFSLIRTARAADARALQRLLEQRCNTVAGLPPARPRDAAALMAAAYGRWPCLVAQYNDTLQGFACASAHREAAGFRWSVDVALFAAPGPRQARVAQALYRELLGQLAQQGVLVVYVTLADSQPELAGLHQALGFTLLEPVAALDLPASAGLWSVALVGGAGGLAPWQQATLPVSVRMPGE